MLIFILGSSVLQVAYPFLMQVWPQGTEELMRIPSTGGGRLALLIVRRSASPGATNLQSTNYQCHILIYSHVCLSPKLEVIYKCSTSGSLSCNKRTASTYHLRFEGSGRILKDPKVAQFLTSLEELLQHVWQGLPVRFALAGRDDEMKIAVEKAALGRLEASEACF